MIKKGSQTIDITSEHTTPMQSLWVKTVNFIAICCQNSDENNYILCMFILLVAEALLR